VSGSHQTLTDTAQDANLTYITERMQWANYAYIGYAWCTRRASSYTLVHTVRKWIPSIFSWVYGSSPSRLGWNEWEKVAQLSNCKRWDEGVVISYNALIHTHVAHTIICRGQNIPKHRSKADPVCTYTCMHTWCRMCARAHTHTYIHIAPYTVCADITSLLTSLSRWAPGECCLGSSLLLLC